MHGFIVVHRCYFMFKSKLFSGYCVFPIFVLNSTLPTPLWHMAAFAEAQSFMPSAITFGIRSEIRTQMRNISASWIDSNLGNHLLTHYVNNIDESIWTIKITWVIFVFDQTSIFRQASTWCCFRIFHHEREKELFRL